MLRISSVFFLFIFIFSCSQEKVKDDITKKKRPITEVKQKTAKCDSLINQEVQSIPLISDVNQKIDWLYPTNKKFKKGTCIARFDNSKLYLTISQLKAQIQNELTTKIETIPPELESRKNIWIEFKNDLSPDLLTPKLPLAFKEEFIWIDESSTILASYDELVKQESKMKDYFLIAKESGTIQIWLTRKGKKITKGQTIALLVKPSK